jgi:hypothetical protein
MLRWSNQFEERGEDGMATELQCELIDFYEFVGRQVADRNVKLSPEQAVALWRHRQQENEAIRKG